MTPKNPEPKSAKNKSTTAKLSKARRINASPPLQRDPAEVLSSQVVQLHDLAGVVVFRLPPKLRQILGSEQLAVELDDLLRTKLRLVVRTSSHIIYTDLPMVIEELPAEFEPVANTRGAAKSASGLFFGRGN